MTDKELIVLAAKAAGVEGKQIQGLDGIAIDEERDGWIFWNPLKNDSAAFRLAVKLGINITLNNINSYQAQIGSVDISCEGEPYAATRRAIVQVAAELGKAMK